MIPIKFRAWDKHSKEMRTVERINFRSDGTYDVWTDCLKDLGGTSPDNLVLMQFTGLLDKNGKEIYEGDIMDSFPLYKGQITKRVVKWNKVNACFDGCFGEEIIGNIFENPGLLDVKKGEGR